MEILNYNELIDCINRKAKAVKKRLWIASPYVSGWRTVLRLLGKDWYVKGAVDVRLLVSGINDGGYINRNTVNNFIIRGVVKQLKGLHAKIYIFDNDVLITSANLSKAAFTENYEIGVFLTSNEAKRVIGIYENWWEGLSEYLRSSDLNKLPLAAPRNLANPNEDRGLKPHSELPEYAGDPAYSIKPYFKNYVFFLNFYKEFEGAYFSVQRLWEEQRRFRYFETDAFLNYLFHEAEGIPSRDYKDNKVRRLSDTSRQNEIRKHAKEFKKWLSELSPSERRKEEERRVRASRRIRNILSKKKIKSLKKGDVEEVCGYLNCLNSYPKNKVYFLRPKNNDLATIRKAWDELLHGLGPLPMRMTYCKGTLEYFGNSSICELLGFFYPDQYPLRNTNVDAGLRFFGYKV